MPKIKSVVDAAQLTKAVHQLVNEDGQEVEFRAIRGHIGAEKEISVGIFIGDKMLKGYQKVKSDFHSLQTFDGMIQRSQKNPKRCLVLTSKHAAAPLKEVAQACFKECKLNYKIVVLQPGDSEPDEVADNDDGDEAQAPERILPLQDKIAEHVKHAFAHGFADLMEKKTTRLIGGSGKVFAPVLAALRKVEIDPSEENLDELETVAQAYLDHAERDYSKADRNDKINQLKIRTAEKLLKDVADLRTLRERQAQLMTPATQHGDVLRRDPVMAGLLDKRDAAIAELEQLQQDPNTPPDDIKKKMHKLRQIRHAVRLAQVQMNTKGFVAKQIGEEYIGETEKSGEWRLKEPPKPPEREPNESDDDFAHRQRRHDAEMALRQKTIESDYLVTKYFTEEERKLYEITTDEHGTLRDAAGKTLKRDVEYVMSPDGKIYQLPKRLEGVRKKVLEPKTDAPMDQILAVHHSSLLAGEEVTGAGGITFDKNGVLKSISNLSGHYKPGAVQMIQTVETLFKQGALLDKEWMDASGAPLQGNTLKIALGINHLLAAIMEKLADDPNADVSAERNTIDQAKKMLTKLGCGPSNRPNAAFVQFMEIKQEMTGADIKVEKKAGITETGAQEFLATGGGNQQQATAKQSMHEELLARTARRKARLDKKYTVRGRGAEGPTDEQISEMAESLGGLAELIAKEPESQEMDFDDWAEESIPVNRHLAKKLGVPIETLKQWVADLGRTVTSYARTDGNSEVEKKLYPDALAKQLNKTPRELYDFLHAKPKNPDDASDQVQEQSGEQKSRAASMKEWLDDPLLIDETLAGKLGIPLATLEKIGEKLGVPVPMGGGYNAQSVPGIFPEVLARVLKRSEQELFDFLVPGEEQSGATMPNDTGESKVDLDDWLSERVDISEATAQAIGVPLATLEKWKEESRTFDSSYATVLLNSNLADRLGKPPGEVYQLLNQGKKGK